MGQGRHSGVFVMEREAETVSLDERKGRGGKTSKKGESETKTKEWCGGRGTWCGGDGTSDDPFRESPPFLQRGLPLVLLVFHKKQNRNQLRPEEK